MHAKWARLDDDDYGVKAGAQSVAVFSLGQVHSFVRSSHSIEAGAKPIAPDRIRLSVRVVVVSAGGTSNSFANDIGQVLVCFPLRRLYCHTHGHCTCRKLERASGRAR